MTCSSTSSMLISTSYNQCHMSHLHSVQFFLGEKMKIRNLVMERYEELKQHFSSWFQVLPVIAKAWRSELCIWKILGLRIVWMLFIWSLPCHLVLSRLFREFFFLSPRSSLEPWNHMKALKFYELYKFFVDDFKENVPVFSWVLKTCSWVGDGARFWQWEHVD